MKNQVWDVAIADIVKILNREGADGIRMNFDELRPNDLRSLNWQEWVEQWKWDGWFVAVVVKDGIGTMYSRKNKYRTGLDCKGLPDNVYLAELIENTEWSYKFENGKYHGKLIILDMLFKNKSYLDELDILRAEKIRGKLPDYIQITCVVQGNIEDIFKRAVALGFEGIVLVNINTGERIKVKKVIEGDYVIMGFLESDSNTAAKKGGMVASLQYGDGKRIIGKCSSMPHEMKIDMYRHPKKYIGRTVVISGREKFRSGALRHSAFERFRDEADKRI